MKLILSLVFLALINISTIQSQFVNFIPYKTSSCVGESIGIGFSVAAGASNCESTWSPFDQKTNFDNWEFLINNDQSISVNQYGQNDIMCAGKPSIQHNFVNGTCGSTPNYVDSGFQIANSTSQKQYSFVTVTNEPTFLPDSQVSFIYGKNCASSNIYAAFSYSKNLELTTDGETVTYTCNNNAPYVITCLQGQKCITQNIFSKCSSKSQYTANYCI